MDPLFLAEAHLGDTVAQVTTAHRCHVMPP